MNDGEPNPMGLDWVRRSIPVPRPREREGVTGESVNGVELCEELLVRLVEGVKTRDEDRESPGLGRGRVLVDGGVIAPGAAGVAV
jgi:hypothetical protein